MGNSSPTDTVFQVVTHAIQLALLAGSAHPARSARSAYKDIKEW